MWRIWMVMDPRKVIIIGGALVATIVATNHFVQLMPALINDAEAWHEYAHLVTTVVRLLSQS